MEALVTQLHVEIWEEVLRPWICISCAENTENPPVYRLTLRSVSQGNQYPRGLGCADFAFPGRYTPENLDRPVGRRVFTAMRVGSVEVNDSNVNGQQKISMNSSGA